MAEKNLMKKFTFTSYCKYTNFYLSFQIYQKFLSKNAKNVLINQVLLKV